MINLDKISLNGKALFLAYDQGMEHGPTDFNDDNIDPNYILDIAEKGEYNGVIFQKGIAEKYYSSQNSVPLIVKLNGKTNLVEGEAFAPLLCSVDEALSLGASAVGYTVYLGSEHENEMTSQLARIVANAHSKDVPVITWIYPRGKSLEGKDPKEISIYGARVGLELGADIIKMKYPGDTETLSKMVEAAGKTRLVVSGGVKEEESEFLATAKDIMTTGAMGMAVGRNIWQHENPLELSKKLKEIIFG